MMIPSRTRTQVKSHAQKLLQNRDNGELRKADKARRIILQLQEEKNPQRRCRHRRRRKASDNEATTPSPSSTTSTAMPIASSSATKMTASKSSTAETPVVKQAQVIEGSVGTPVVHVPNASDLTNRAIVYNDSETMATMTQYSPSNDAKPLVSILTSLNNQDQAALYDPNTVSSHQATQRASDVGSSHQATRHAITTDSSHQAPSHAFGTASSNQAIRYATNVDSSHKTTRRFSNMASRHNPTSCVSNMTSSNQSTLCDPKMAMSPYDPIIDSSNQPMPQFVSNMGLRNQPIPQYFSDVASIKNVASNLMTLSSQETQIPVRRIILQSMTIPKIIHTSTNRTSSQRSVPLSNQATRHATTVDSRSIPADPHIFDTASINQSIQDASHTAPSHHAAVFDPSTAPSHQAALHNPNTASSDQAALYDPKIASTYQAMPQLVSTTASSNQATQFVSNMVSSNQPMPLFDFTVAPVKHTLAHSVLNLMSSSNEDTNHPVRRITMQSMTIPRIVYTSTNQKSFQQSISISPGNQEALPIMCDGSPRYLNEELSFNDDSCSSSLWSPYPCRIHPAPQPPSAVLRLLTREQHDGFVPIDPLAQYYLNPTYISGFPTNYDVLCDHVNDVFCNHVGNRRLRIMVMARLCEYTDSASSTALSFVSNIMEKREDDRTRLFILEFIESLTTCTPQCRFLAMDVSVGRWRELNGEYSIMKIQKTFRACKEAME